MAYKLLWRMVYPSVYGVLRNREEAEDIMQESFIRGFEKLGELKDPQRYPAWQKQISLRMALNHLRRKNIYQVQFREELAEEYSESTEVEVSDIQLAMKCIDEMPEGYGLVIRLHLLEGLSHEEIAEALGIAPGTARSQYSRAMQRLKNSIRQIHAGKI